MTTTTLNAYKLLRLINQTRNHMCGDDTLPINGIRFENDGTHLHALATDRFTFAAARTKLRATNEPWATTVSRNDLTWLRRWIIAHDGSVIVDLTVDSDKLTLSSERGTVAIPATNSFFPKWQNLFRDTLRDASTSGELVSVDTEFLTRWKDAGTHLRVWQSTPTKPLLLVGDDFLGLQMPARYSGDDKDRAAILGTWIGSLGEGSEPAEMPAPPEQIDAPKMAEQMLRQTLRSTSELFSGDTPSENPEAFNAWVSSGIYAWSAYRLLEALKKADPDLAETTVRDLNEQLESGEIGEWAWDEAEKHGHDPQKWHDDYEAHLKDRAAKKAAEADVIPAA